MSSTEKSLLRSSTAASTANDETDYSDEYEEVSTIPSTVRSTTEAEKERMIVPLEVKFLTRTNHSIPKIHTVPGLTIIVNHTNNYTDNQTNHYDRIH